MLYRIDMKNFLVHAIDYFSLSDLTHMEYCIISAKIPNGGKDKHCVKMNDLYPSSDTIVAYTETGDKKLLEEMYIGMMKSKDKNIESNPYSIRIYQTFINPFLQHVNMMIICDESENDFIDALCKYLKEEFGIEVVDLNQLFTKGRVGSVYIDRGEVRDKAVDIRRAAVRDQTRAMASTRDGKEMLIEKMKRKKKIAMLKEYGIKVNPDDNVDAILLEEWCREDGQWDED